MRDIVVIGAGQGGLLLGLGLLQRGYRVTLVSDRTAEEIRHGQVPAGVVIFQQARALERELKVNFWDDTALACHDLHVDIINPDGTIALTFEAPLEQPALCVDLRLKFHHWLREFERRGGRVIVKPATVSDLEDYARQADLVVVSAGKGELSGLFPKDTVNSKYESPPRHVSMVVVTGYKPWDNFKRPGPKFMILPGLGEVFSAPIYAKDEVQAIFLGYEPIPGSPLDRVTAGMTPEAQLALSKQIFQEFIPRDYEAIRDTELVDRRAHLFGKIVPIVRHPVGTLPSGAHVMGMGDTVNLHDPIATQGANNAAKSARIIAQRIAEHGDRPFDAAWMEQVSAEIWSHTKYSNLLADALLAPPPPHVLQFFGAAAQHPVAARRFANSFTNPPDMFPWFYEPDEMGRYLQSLAQP